MDPIGFIVAFILAIAVTAAADDSSSNFSDYTLELTAMRNFARQGKFDESYNIAESLKVSSSNTNNPLDNDATFMLELGVIQYFRGKYADAFQFCQRAAFLDPQSILAFGCQGSSAMYLDLENEAMDSLQYALQLFKSKKKEADFDVMGSLHGENGNEVENYWFHMEENSIQVSYLTCLMKFSRRQECIDATISITRLPQPSKGGVIIFFLSFVEWTGPRIVKINELEAGLRQQNELDLPLNVSLLSEIQRLQQDFGFLINIAEDCFRVGLIDLSLRDKAYEYLMELMVYSQDTSSVSETTSTSTISTTAETTRTLSSINDESVGLVLMTQYYISNNEKRQSELNQVLTLNIANPSISKVVLFIEEDFIEGDRGCKNLAECQYFNFTNILGHVSGLSKIEQVPYGRRLTFSDAFAYTNSNLVGKTVAIANADIYFDESLQRLFHNNKYILENNRVLALLAMRQHEQGGGLTCILRSIQMPGYSSHLCMNPLLQNLTSTWAFLVVTIDSQPSFKNTA